MIVIALQLKESNFQEFDCKNGNLFRIRPAFRRLEVRQVPWLSNRESAPIEESVTTAALLFWVWRHRRGQANKQPANSQCVRTPRTGIRRS
jgi:hypothetical protein